MKGVTQGADQRTREIAKNMLLKNEPIGKIIEYTELSEADIGAIKSEIDQK